MQIILSEDEYNNLKFRADLLQTIIDDCSSEGVFYTRKLEKYTTDIARYMRCVIGSYHNCKISND